MGSPFIDLNADLGEYQDEEGRRCERAILTHVSSCNIACGGHAGNRETMRTTLEAASAAGVACGAHPSYPDRAGFGRISMEIDHGLLLATLKEQVTALKTVARSEGVELTHLKLHGALYNDAAINAALAIVVADCMSLLPAGAALVGLPGSAVEAVAQARGIPFRAEGFVDRRYTTEGRLVPRDQEGAVINSPDECARQAVSLARDSAAETLSGKRLSLKVETLCLHGDSPAAVQVAEAVSSALTGAGLDVRAEVS